jgi:hypothetical protein
MYSAQGIFQHHFQCKKVHSILTKIRYTIDASLVSLVAALSAEIYSNLCHNLGHTVALLESNLDVQQTHL